MLSFPVKSTEEATFAAQIVISRSRDRL